VWLYLIKHKYDISHIFSIFKSLVENQLSTKIKIFYSYNGGEYLKLRYFFFQTHEITCLITLPYIPKHNGLSKRKHCHLVETAHKNKDLMKPNKTKQARQNKQDKASKQLEEIWDLVLCE